MKYTNVGNSTTSISQIGLGTWQFGTKGWGYGTDFTKKNAIEIVHKSIDLGITLFDTAEIYGRGSSERILGEAIKDYNREDIVISTKFFPLVFRPSAIKRALEKSLERLQTDYIDIYLIHWPNPLLPLGRTLKYLNEMVDENKIRYIGVSNFSQKRFHKAQKKSPKRIELNQVNYSIVKNKVEESFLPYAKVEKVTIMAYSPLAQGWLTGKYSAETGGPGGTRRTNRLFRKKNLKKASYLFNTLKEISSQHDITQAQLALAWLLKNKEVVAIPGAKNIKQLEENIASTEITLTDIEISAIYNAVKEYHSM